MLSFAAIPPDAVVLKPAWSALLSSLRFARRARWQFGNATAVLQCRERGPRRWLTERRTDLRLRFDVRHWASAFARSTGTAREIGIVADDGSPVASIHLEHVDGAIDELIWRLIDDDFIPPAALPAQPAGDERIADELAVAESRDAFDRIASRLCLARADALTAAGPAIARPLAPAVLPIALRNAQAAGLSVRARIENVGGGVTWNPGRIEFDSDAARHTLRAGGVDLIVPAPNAGLWALALETPDACCPALECCVPGDRGWLRIDVDVDTVAACETWRRICATLEEQ